MAFLVFIKVWLSPESHPHLPIFSFSVIILSLNDDYCHVHQIFTSCRTPPMLRMTRLFSCRDFWIMNGSGGWVWNFAIILRGSCNVILVMKLFKKFWCWQKKKLWRNYAAMLEDNLETSGRRGAPEWGDSGSLKINHDHHQRHEMGIPWYWWHRLKDEDDTHLKTPRRSPSSASCSL